MNKNIYTWGAVPAERNYTVIDLRKAKGHKKLVQTTANTLEEAQAVSEADFYMVMCKSNNIKFVRLGAPKIFLTASIDLSKFPTEKEVS